jgi:hypothetical protein
MFKIFSQPFIDAIYEWPNDNSIPITMPKNL